MGYFLVKLLFKTFWSFSEITILYLSLVEGKTKVFILTWPLKTGVWKTTLAVLKICTLLPNARHLEHIIFLYQKQSTATSLLIALSVCNCSRFPFRLYKSFKSALDLGTPCFSFPSPCPNKTGHGAIPAENSLFLDKYKDRKSVV